MSNQTTITCRNCKTQIDVNEIQYHEFEEQLQKATKDQVQFEKIFR